MGGKGGNSLFLTWAWGRMEVQYPLVSHQKETHTDRYIHFSSHHHPRIMTGVICCLKQRADRICDEHMLNSEHRHLQKTFEANGYPRSKNGTTNHQTKRKGFWNSQYWEWDRETQNTHPPLPKEHLWMDPKNLRRHWREDSVQVPW